MTDLEQRLRALAGEVAWPETPQLTLALGVRRRSRALLGAIALALLALAIAFAVPPARSAILRFFHLGAVTVERVDALPPTRERALGTGLGARVGVARATVVLGATPLVPTGATLRLRGGVISTLLATPTPVLLSELQSDGPYLVKKLAGVGTNVVPADVGSGVTAIWISGKPHDLLFFDEPPRLAGNVLVWTHGDLTLRLEGPQLTEAKAVRLARALDGT